MKSNLYPIRLRVLACFLSLSTIALTAQSQAPIYRFSNPTLVSGTDRQVGAKYRFPNVIANVDAFVEVLTMTNGITLQSIDRTADGYSEAFQPEYRIASLVNAYIDFRITFVQGGTSTPQSQTKVDASGLDIDGSSSGLLALKEYNTIDMGGGLCTFNTTASQLSISRVGTGYSGSNITGFLFGALVDTAAYQVMFTVSKHNLTSFTYRVGAATLLSNSSTRYASLYFKRFNYPQWSVLPVANLQNFTGNELGGKTQLQWTLTPGNNASSVVLERAENPNSFSPLVTYWMNMEDGVAKNDYNYTNSGKESNAGVVYYRLKITGKDGKIEYSNTLRFSTEAQSNTSMIVYPSRVNSAATVQIRSTANQQANFEVFDYSGNMVFHQAVSLQTGENNIRINNLDGLPIGNYISTLRTPEKTHSFKISKL